jgi:hypothetical protein
MGYLNNAFIKDSAPQRKVCHENWLSLRQLIHDSPDQRQSSWNRREPVITLAVPNQRLFNARPEGISDMKRAFSNSAGPGLLLFQVHSQRNSLGAEALAPAQVLEA